ncbi:MAG: hypothetical protein QNL53_01640 [Microbacteriaceae bacterium]|jgi:uncharacterized protein|tara:strand:- start:5463 stop:6203 length:741 start_codon:yes stop_codon:yes gene_type:complete
MALVAPPEKQARLLELADCDLALARAQATLRGLPVALHVPTLEAAIDEIKTRRHDTFVELEGIRSELERAESDVKLVQARIAKDSERLQHTANAKEAMGLEHELESLRTRAAHLEDIELAIMEKLEVSESALAGRDAELATADAALLGARDEQDRQTQELTAETRRQREIRDAIVADLSQDLVELYERQRERYGAGASHLRFGVSSASGVALTESDLQHVREAPLDEVVMCPNSNAILVRTAESGI